MTRIESRGNGNGSGSTPHSRGARRGSMHGRTQSASAAVDLAALFPATTLPGAGSGHHRHKGRTKHGRMGAHGRSRSPLPIEARKDPWKHKYQAAGQG